MTISRWKQQFAVLSLFVGLFSLRATLFQSFRPYGGRSQTGCQGWTYEKITWQSDFTLEFYERGCSAFVADAAAPVFITVTACGAIMTLYGAVTLFRHGLPNTEE